MINHLKRAGSQVQVVGLPGSQVASCQRLRDEPTPPQRKSDTLATAQPQRRPAMSMPWKNWTRGLAAFLIALGAHAPASGANPHVLARRRRQRRAAGGAARRHRHHHQYRHRAHPHGDHRRRWPLCVHVDADRRAVPRAGGADRLRHRGARRPRLQRRPARGDQLRAAALDGAGDHHGRRRRADRADHVVGSVDARSIARRSRPCR